MLIIAGSNLFKHDFNKYLGIRSSSHCSDGTDCEIFESSSRYDGLKDVK